MSANAASMPSRRRSFYRVRIPSPRPLEDHGRQPRHLIESAVAQVFGVRHIDLDRPTRGRKRVALARQVSMYLAHVVCGYKLGDVGSLFARDRTTVAHACEVVEDRRDDPTFDRVVELLERVVPALIVPRHGRTVHFE